MVKINFLLLLAVGLVFASCSKSEPPRGGDSPNGSENPPPQGSGANKLPYPIDSVFVVSSVPEATREKTRLNQSFLSSDFSPTGWYVNANEKIVVNLRRTKGNNYPTLIIGTYNKYSGSKNVQVVYLTPGNNTVVPEYSGLVFIRYDGDANMHQSTVKFMSGMYPAPIYIAGKTTKQQWRGMLNTYTTSSDAVLYGGKIIIALNRRVALDNIAQDQELLLANANQIWEWQEDISGLDGSSAKHSRNPHNHLMTEYNNDTYFMAAFNYGTFYNHKTAIQVLVRPSDLNSWGPWHEMGHHHQQEAYKWSDLTEVTVNIYSLYVEKKLGITPGRLKSSGAWAKIRTYLNQSELVKNYDTIEDLFVKLGLFAQLSMAYGDDFYIRLHKDTREDLPVTNTDLAKKRYFMLKACEISGYDLSRFFKDWGMNGVQSVYPEIEAMNLPAPTINPSSLQE